MRQNHIHSLTKTNCSNFCTPSNLEMSYQRCQYKDITKENTGYRREPQLYVLSDDKRDQLPKLDSFTPINKQVPVKRDDRGERLKPSSVQACTRKGVDCHTLPHHAKNSTNTDYISQQLQEIHNSLIQDIESLSKKVDNIPHLLYEMEEYTIPHHFIVLPEDTSNYNPANWFHMKYRLYFLCEYQENNEYHLAFHEGYELKQPREFLRMYGPYLRKMLRTVKLTLSVGSFVIPQLTNIVSGASSSLPKCKVTSDKLNVQIEKLKDILIEAEKSFDIATDSTSHYVEGADLRQLERFLKKNDEHRKFGNLDRTISNDGHVKWMCIRHSQTHYNNTEIKLLYDRFQELGGEIQGDVAIVKGKDSKQNSELFAILEKGLPVSSILLQNLEVDEKHFNKLLTFVSQQTLIRNLELTNINIPILFIRTMKKRDIAMKLRDIVENNRKLTIQYSFTKSLNKFESRLFDFITNTNPRLVFQVRSEENLPAFELTGATKRGFSLCMNEYNGKDNKHYIVAIENMFSKVSNISKVVLNIGVVWEKISKSFWQFLTVTGTLEELTISCQLTLEQTKTLFTLLSNNKTLKILNIFNVWKEIHDVKLFKEIFQALQVNTTLVEFNLACDTNSLPLDSISNCLYGNSTLEVLRLPKCLIEQTTRIGFFKEFLQNTSIHTLSLELIYPNREVSLRQLVHAIDKNKNLQTLELKGPDSTAVFHRKKIEIPKVEIVPVPSLAKETGHRPSRHKYKKFLSLFSCFGKTQRRHSIEETTSDPLVENRIDNNTKEVPLGPFYTLCNHPILYKQMQEISKKFQLEELQVSVENTIEMQELVSSIKSNKKVTRLMINRRTVIQKDIDELVDALQKNTTITHLTLNNINIPMRYFHRIFNVLRDDQIVRVLEINHCVSTSDHNPFIRAVEELESVNPYLKIVYVNS